jgi:hypothetical protein
MNLKITFFALIFFATRILSVNGQSIEKPNYALKSHQTLEISKVDITEQKTMIYLNIENKIAGGYFCADKNIFILYPDGTKSNLISSKGIPVCPDTYKFNMIGEKLEFELTFSTVKKNTGWIDLIEDCTDNCFSFYGICLNAELNKKIEDAAHFAEIGEPAKATLDFIAIANAIYAKNSGIDGLIYMNIIQLSKETGNMAKASEWYVKLKSSDIPRRELYIKHLNSQGIRY